MILQSHSNDHAVMLALLYPLSTLAILSMNVRGSLKREYVGEMKLPPEVLAKLEELKRKKHE